MANTAIASCPICQQLASIASGSHPRHIATLSHCDVVLHDQQGQRGWCVLLLKQHIEHLTDLPGSIQREIFGEVAAVAAAVREVTGCGRINYECLGNVAAHVHWHVIPRYTTDFDTKAPVWGFPADRLGVKLDPTVQTDLIGRIHRCLRL